MNGTCVSRKSTSNDQVEFINFTANVFDFRRYNIGIPLMKKCGLPVERYFNPELMREESAERQRVSHKLQLCPEEYLPIVEGAIDGALRIHEQEKEPACV